MSSGKGVALSQVHLRSEDLLRPTWDEHLLEIRDAPFWRFSRWGDGEWRAVFQDRPHTKNCDGHQYFPELGAALRDVLARHRVPVDGYRLAMQPLALRLFADRIGETLGSLGWPEAATWYDADVCHKASQRGELGRLFILMRRMPVVFVGPEHLRVWVTDRFPRSEFVVVPSIDCWLSRADILQSIFKLLAGRERTLVALSCSMLAEVLIEDLDLLFPRAHLFVDFGSVWDPYAGKLSRKYHKDLEVCDDGSAE